MKIYIILFLMLFLLGCTTISERKYSCEYDQDCRLFNINDYNKVDYSCSSCDCGGERINLSSSDYISVNKDFNRLSWYKRFSKKFYSNYICRGGFMSCMCVSTPPIYTSEIY